MEGVAELEERTGIAFAVENMYPWRASRRQMQVYAPHWNSRFCELPDEARRTRRRLLEYCAERGALLFPIHFGAPHVAAIARAGDAFSLRFIAAGGSAHRPGP